MGILFSMDIEFSIVAFVISKVFVFPKRLKSQKGTRVREFAFQTVLKNLLARNYINSEVIPACHENISVGYSKIV